MTPSPDPRVTMTTLWVALTSQHLVLTAVAFFAVTGPEVDLDLTVQGVLAAGAVAAGAAAWPARRMLGARGGAPEEAADRWKAAQIVPLALAEAVTLQGFVLAFLAQRATAILPFAVVGLALSASLRPGDPPR